MLMLAIAILILIAVLGAVLVWLLDAERNWKRASQELEDKQERKQ